MELMLAIPNLRLWPLAAGFSLLLGFACPQTGLLDASIRICLQPMDAGSCRAISYRWYYDRNSQTCKEFIYGGCQGNDNNFWSSDECFQRCHSIPRVPRQCRPEAEEGICRGLIRKYFFNLKTMDCERFYYGGCYGNENRFDNKRSCMETCVKTGPSFCYSPKDGGLCSASVPRFFYNIKTKTCEEFSYTGCGGNDNNFTSKKECLEACKTAGRWNPRL